MKAKSSVNEVVNQRYKRIGIIANRCGDLQQSRHHCDELQALQ